MHSDLIYDVGMHVANDTTYYLSRGFRVVAIEADPSLVAAQRVKLADAIRAGRLTLLNYAIGPKVGTAPFWICQEHSALSTMDEGIVRASRFHFQAVEVPCGTIESVFQEHGVPYYLKVDIEGHDRYCLEAIDPADAPTYVSFEILNLADLLLLHSKGYSAFKCVDQDTLSALRAPAERADLKGYLKTVLTEHPWLARLAKGPLALRSALTKNGASTVARPLDAPVLVREGWSFYLGSTGPFGDEAAGEWCSLEDVAYTWLAWRRRMPGNEGWFDIHAKRDAAG